MTDRKPPGKKEGAWEVDQSAPEEERVLGEPGVGRAKKQEVLQAAAEEDSIHPNNTV
jgi:hypothetical protein